MTLQEQLIVSLVVAVAASVFAWALTWVANNYAFRRQRRFKLWERQIERVESLVDSVVDLVAIADKYHAKLAGVARDAKHAKELEDSLSPPGVHSEVPAEVRPEPAKDGRQRVNQIPGTDGAGVRMALEAELEAYRTSINRAWDEADQLLDSLYVGIAEIRWQLRAMNKHFDVLNDKYADLSVALSKLVGTAMRHLDFGSSSAESSQFAAIRPVLSALGDFLDALIVVRDELPVLSRAKSSQ